MELGFTFILHCKEASEGKNELDLRSANAKHGIDMGRLMDMVFILLIFSWSRPRSRGNRCGCHEAAGRTAGALNKEHHDCDYARGTVHINERQVDLIALKDVLQQTISSSDREVAHHHWMGLQAGTRAGDEHLHSRVSKSFHRGAGQMIRKALKFLLLALLSFICSAALIFSVTVANFFAKGGIFRERKYAHGN